MHATKPSSAALDRLREGNRRFVEGKPNHGGEPHHLRRGAVAAEQKPFATILGCSDSRVPAEIVFDQGLGDLFVIRIVGNIVAPSQVGSVEFAATRFGTPLVVVLGHSKCGAVLAALEELQGNAAPNHTDLARSIVDGILPSVAGLLESDMHHDRDALVKCAIRANIEASVGHLRHDSAILERLVESGRLEIVGAEYSLESGEVEFLSPG